MAIGNIDICVVLNDKQSLVNPLFTSSLVNWWLRFSDHGALHQLTMRSCHFYNAMVDIPKARIATRSCHDVHVAILGKCCNLILRPWGYI
jgi:hypothetical protein